MPDDPHHLVQRLLEEGQKTLSFFGGLSEEGWNLTIYGEGEIWTIRQILAHFVSAEEGFATLLQDVLQGGSGAPESFDIDRFNQKSVASLRDVPIPELTERFWRLRERNAEIVSRMTPDDLQRRGRHPFLGDASLEEMIKLIYRHNQLHLRDIRRAMA